MDKIEVTQNARQAAFDAYLTCYEIVPNDLWLQALLDGKHDGDEMAQAFARFERDILATRTDATPVAWMPIECAPKDGTVVLFATPEPGDWRYHMSRADDRWNGAYWLNKATHWMHLPAAPRGE